MSHGMAAATIPLTIKGLMALDVEMSWGHLGWGCLDHTCKREDKQKGALGIPPVPRFWRVGKGGVMCEGGGMPSP